MVRSALSHSALLIAAVSILDFAAGRRTLSISGKFSSRGRSCRAGELPRSNFRSACADSNVVLLDGFNRSSFVDCLKAAPRRDVSARFRIRQYTSSRNNLLAGDDSSSDLTAGDISDSCVDCIADSWQSAYASTQCANACAPQTFSSSEEETTQRKSCLACVESIEDSLRACLGEESPPLSAETPATTEEPSLAVTADVVAAPHAAPIEQHSSSDGSAAEDTTTASSAPASQVSAEEMTSPTPQVARTLDADLNTKAAEELVLQAANSTTAAPLEIKPHAVNSTTAAPLEAKPATLEAKHASRKADVHNYALSAVMLGLAATVAMILLEMQPIARKPLSTPHSQPTATPDLRFESAAESFGNLTPLRGGGSASGAD